MAQSGVVVKFEQRLQQAFEAARAGQTVLVIVPAVHDAARDAFNTLTRMLDRQRDWNARAMGTELHFHGTGGSVRVYSTDHATYDPHSKRLREYPHSVPVLLHPEVEAL
jgi:hypothetical protein